MTEQKETGNPIETVIDEAVAKYQPVEESGLAIAVVEQDDIVFSKCYGFADRENKAKVADDTLFAIGSCTKQFTSLAAMMLQDEGKLSIENPVREYVSDYAVMDPDASAEMTLEDLLCQRAGISRHDSLWYLTTLSRKELDDRLRFLEPNAEMGFGFRQAHQYNNLLYSSSASILEAVSGTAWADFIQQRIIDTVGMGATRTNSLPAGPGEALPYAGDRQIPRKDYTNIAPAASINSNLQDMCRWVQMFLAWGKTSKGEQIVSSEAITNLFTNRFPNMEVGYGLGWQVQQFAGSKLVWHGGSADGFSAWTSLMPDSGFGIVALSNQNGTDFPNQVGMTAYADILGQDAPQYPAPYVPPEAQALVDHPDGGHGLAGSYHHPAFGTIEVKADGQAYVMDYFDNHWDLSTSKSGGHQIMIDAFGAAFPVTLQFGENPTWGTYLKAPWTQSAEWVTFNKSHSS